MLTALFLFLLGLIIGSFLNVVGLRWNSGIPATKGRSFCVVCRKDLQWWELIPVISYLGLKGHCSECKTKISWQYPLIELWTGLVFSSLYLGMNPTLTLISLISYILVVTVFCVFVVITIYDARHKIVPDELVYVAISLSLLYRFINMGSVYDFLAGPIFFAFFGLIWLFSQGRAMGFGDAKLSLSIGLLLGFSVGLSGIVLAFWIGSLAALLYIILFRLHASLFRGGKGLTMKSEIPFAPFLILGAWISLIFHFDLLHVLLFIK